MQLQAIYIYAIYNPHPKVDDNPASDDHDHEFQSCAVVYNTIYIQALDPHVCQESENVAAPEEQEEELPSVEIEASQIESSRNFIPN